MASKIGVKTYARQKITCHPSNIQFDQLLDEKGNKPCAAKSQGTLHRWGMTSFTSLRNSQMNGRKEKAEAAEAETKKRKTETATTKTTTTTEANDPFSFDFDTGGNKKSGKRNNASSKSSANSAVSNVAAPAPARSNKFFKSGSSRSSIFGARSNAGPQRQPASHSVRAVPLINAPNLAKQNVYFESVNNNSAPPGLKSNPVVARDAFAELLLSAEVPGVAGVSSADMSLNHTYPGESEVVSSSMFSTYAPQTVRAYNTAAVPPSNLVTQTFSYDQNFYHQSAAPEVNAAIQNQVLFPVSTIPQSQNSVIQPEVIFSCHSAIIQTQSQAAPLQSSFSQNQMPLMDNDLSLRLVSNQPNVLGNDVIVNNFQGLTSQQPYSKAPPPYVAEQDEDEDIFDSIRKTTPSYTGYAAAAIHQEQLPKVKPIVADFPHLTRENTVDMKQHDLMQDLGANHDFMMTNEEAQAQDLQSSLQMSGKDDFTSPMIDISDTTSIIKKDDWVMNDHNNGLVQEPIGSAVCDENVLSDQRQSLENNLASIRTSVVEPAKKDWEIFSTSEENVGSESAAGAGLSTNSETLLESTQPFTEEIPVHPAKQESKIWKMSYETVGKPRLNSSLSFGSSSSKAYSTFAQRRIFNSPKKIERKAVYKHRPWQAEEEREERIVVNTNSIVDEFDEFENESSFEKPSLHRVVTWPAAGAPDDEEAITAVKCEKKFRDYFTVVRNVKQAHQCHESGETQEYNDDIEYLLESLQDMSNTGTRCLSLLSLATKCMAPAFRMHLRAHGALTKVFSALHDAPKQPNLALCTATVLFVLSQDRLNMDLERSSLDLMLQLLDTDSTIIESTSFGDSSSRRDREFDKNKEKVVELCDELQKKGYAKHLDLDNMTAGVLAMESLLSLTSKRAGEWFKEELRELGGLEHLVNTVSECGKCLPPVLVQLTSYALDKLRKLDRCLRVLENVTVMNSENQYYLINCQDSSLIHFCARALQLCETCLEVYPMPDSSDKESPSWTLYSCLSSTMKVLLNLTNENCNGSAKVGEQEGLINSLLSCILFLPSHLTAEQRFDVLVLSLGLLINLVEYCENNRKRLFFAEVSSPNTTHSRRFNGTIPAPKALVNLFLEHEEAARVEEAKTDKLLDGKGDQDAEPSNKNDSSAPAPNSVDDIEETLKKALQKAGKNMEDSMIAAYVALLLGCIIQNNKESAARIRDHLPNKCFDSMVQMLNKFLNFMTLTDIVGSTGMKSIKRVIEILENS